MWVSTPDRANIPRPKVATSDQKLGDRSSSRVRQLRSSAGGRSGGGGGAPSGELADAIAKSFGGFEAFKGFLLAASNAVAGSGWGVLAYREMDDALVVLQAEKHENLTQWGVVPILVLDVWEHAYYLKYQNKRPEWTKAFMDNLVNWDDVAERLAEARKK